VPAGRGKKIANPTTPSRKMKAASTKAFTHPS
jgi:hypothetical protein